MNSADDPTRPHGAPSAGAAVAHYRLVERIGSGGMGEVHLAEDTKLDRRVALKFLAPGLADDPELRARFLREARTAARLDHPNVVTIHEVGEADGRPYIAMQFVEGKPLSALAAGGALDPPRALRIVAGICDGLACAHAAGITHRDVKPANVIVDAGERPVLLDFGLATLHGGDKLTKAGSTLGTVAYMSPEQARGREVDARSDLFSVGVVLYELLAGMSPFRRAHEVATLQAILHEVPEPLARYRSGLPDGVQSVVSRCLAREPADRYQSAADLAADLRRIERAATGDATAGIPAAGGGVGPGSTPSLAVLPFGNMSADAENEFFADGLTEELLNVLAKNPGLKVTGRTSSFAFKGKQEDMRSIGRKLGVQALLEGSVRKSGNRVRITAQLVNVADGFHLWSETYDRVLDDVFAVQDDIAGAVGKALHVKLLGGQRGRDAAEGDAHLYALLLRANHARLQTSKESLATAERLYREAVERAPGSARAWAGLADCLGNRAAYGHADVGPTYAEAKRAAQRALELDDTLMEPHLVMGFLLAAFDQRFRESLAASRRALECAPGHPRALVGMALIAAVLGDMAEALPLARQAAEVDPLDAEAHMEYGRILFWAERHAESEAALRRALELSPGFTAARMILSWALVFQGRAEEGLVQARGEDMAGYRTCGEAIALHTLGRRAESDRALAELRSCGDAWAFQMACAHAWRGEADAAFEWLERAQALHDSGVALTAVSPVLRGLREDPRWVPFLRRIGLVEGPTTR